MDYGRDILVFVGDYIDRGPASREVVQFIMELRGEMSQVVCLKGNHEQMFLNYCLEGKDPDLYFFNGGARTLISYGLADMSPPLDLPREHLEFFTSLSLYYETEDFLFVHAGLRPGIPLAQQREDDLLWIRGDFIHTPHIWDKTVVFGHTVLSRTGPYFGKGKVGIDTGAVYGGRLTCLELPRMNVYQA